jgi:hypothetical protein
VLGLIDKALAPGRLSPSSSPHWISYLAFNFNPGEPGSLSRIRGSSWPRSNHLNCSAATTTSSIGRIAYSAVHLAASGLLAHFYASVPLGGAERFIDR